MNRRDFVERAGAVGVLASLVTGAGIWLANNIGYWEIEKEANVSLHDVTLARHTASGEKIFTIRKDDKNIGTFLDSDADGILEGPFGGIREYAWDDPTYVAQSLYDMLEGYYDP